MNQLPIVFISAVLIGVGATLTFDLGAQILKHAFRLNPSNLCLVGRWLLYMPEGIFKHSNLGSAAPKRAECPAGWIAHYLIGITFALAFVAIVGSSWLASPTLLPAVVYGVVTVLAPFLVMQPLFGLGVAASKTSNPAQARLRSLMNHISFGVGLYVFAVLVQGMLSIS